MACLLKRLQCHRGELRTVIGPSSLLIIKARATWICVRTGGPGLRNRGQKARSRGDRHSLID